MAIDRDAVGDDIATIMDWSNPRWPFYAAYIYQWTRLLEGELLAAEPNQQKINRYRKALSTIKQALECCQANMNLNKHFIAQDTPTLGLLAAARNIDNHAAEGRTKYDEAQAFFYQAANKYFYENAEEGDKLSTGAQTAKKEAELLDPTISSDYLMK